MASEPEPIVRTSQVGNWPGSEKVSEEAELGVDLRKEPAAGTHEKRGGLECDH